MTKTPSFKATRWTLTVHDIDGGSFESTREFKEPVTFLHALGYFPLYHRWNYIAVSAGGTTVDP